MVQLYSCGSVSDKSLGIENRPSAIREASATIRPTQPHAASLHQMLRRSIDYGIYLALRLVITVIQALPLAVCERGACGLASFFSRVVGIRRRVIDDNLRTAFPDMSTQER